MSVDINEGSKFGFFYVDPHTLELSGNPSKFKLRAAQFMNLWAVISEVFLLLQIIHIFAYQNSEGVSAPAYFVYGLSAIVWLVYARFVLARPNMPLIINNILDVILSSVLLVGIYVY